jgi:hypothetical protein
MNDMQKKILDLLTEVHGKLNLQLGMMPDAKSPKRESAWKSAERLRRVEENLRHALSELSE